MYPLSFSARPAGPSQQRCFGYFGCLQAVPSGILNIEKIEGSNEASDGLGLEFPPSLGSHIDPSGFCNFLLSPSLAQLLIAGGAVRNGSLVSDVRCSFSEKSIGSTDAVDDKIGSGSG